MAVKSEYLGGTDWNDGEVLYSDDLLDTTKQATIVSGPIGCVFAWLKTLTNTPALPNNWVECNGQTLSDAESVYNGVVIPNLNANRFLRGSSTSGTTGGSETHNHSMTTIKNGELGTTSNYYFLNNVQATQNSSSLPSYYEVVWIMRIK